MERVYNGDETVARIAVNHGIVRTKEFRGLHQIVYVRCRARNRVDVTRAVHEQADLLQTCFEVRMTTIANRVLNALIGQIEP